MDLFEAINTQRAMRRLLPEPVPDELIWRILEAATRAPSGGNYQLWSFIVIRDPDIRQRIAGLYLDGYRRSQAGLGEAIQASEMAIRMTRSADYLAQHMAEVPVLILVTARPAYTDPITPPGASIFPAVQNLMLAARALGLGTTLTTVHRHHEAEIKELLGIPEDVETMALIPVGWPRGRFGSGARRPVEKVTYWDRWGLRREL